MVDIKEYLEKTEAELKEEEKSKRKELVLLQFQLTARQLTDVSQIKKAKKDIARLQTALQVKASKEGQ